MQISLLVAFLAGVGSFFSPCVLPLLPVYFSVITGLSPGEKGSGAFRSSLLFVFGFSAVFVLLGVALSGFGQFLLLKRPFFMIVGGGVVLFFSLSLLGWVRIPFLQRERKIHLSLAIPFFGPFLTGAAYAFGWSPCVGPILGAILTYTATTQDPRGGALLLASYSLGMALPFLTISLFWGKVMTILKRIKKATSYIMWSTSLLLMGVGAWMVFRGIRAL